MPSFRVTRLGAVLASLLAGAFIAFHMLATTRNSNQPPNLRVSQKFDFGPSNRTGDSSLDNGVFLLGVGKADITG